MDSRVFSEALIDLAVLSEATEWSIFGDMQTEENTLTDHDIQALIGFVFLKRPVKLQLFNLGLTDNEVISILRHLNTNDSITHLDLSCNRITDESASAIASLLLENHTLKELVLTSNKLTNEGIRCIAQALIINNTLCSLDILNNLHTEEALQIFQDALASNHEITEVKLFTQIASSSVLGKTLVKVNRMEPHDKTVAAAKPSKLASILDKNDSHHKQTDERLKKLSLFAQSDKKAIKLAKAKTSNQVLNSDNKTKLSKIGKSDRLPKFNGH